MGFYVTRIEQEHTHSPALGKGRVARNSPWRGEGALKAFLTLALLALFTAPIAIYAQGENPVEPQWQLWKVNVDGTGLAPLAETPGFSCGSPKWSPNGKFVAFDTRRLGEQLQQSQIAVVRADGSDVRIRADTICLHGDGANAVALASRIKAELKNAGLKLKACTAKKT